MRALITTDTIGGVWSYTRELVSGLLAENISVMLVTLGRPLSSDQSAWTQSITARFPESLVLIPTSYRLEWMEDAGQDVEASRRYVESLVHSYKPDVLHTNQFCFASLDLSIPCILVAHSDVQSWWFAVHGISPPDTNWLRRYTSTVREGVHGATVVVAPTRWMLNEIENIYGKPACSRVISNGCTPEQFHSDQSKELQALSLGRLWDEGKNIRILEQVRSPMPILIAGDTRQPEGSTSVAYTSQPDSSLRFLGMLTENEAQNLLASSAIYIATSRYEPFGLAPLEAAFSRCAIVANDIPSLREVWGENATYYRRNDPASLATCLCSLAGDPVFLAQMAEKANRRAHAQFNATSMISAYLNLYNNVLQSVCSTAHA